MRCLHLVIPLAVALGASAAPFAASAQIGLDVSVTIAPPELPVYEQPPLPAPGYIFAPGYWAYGGEGYYWVPGTWVEPPEPGLLWTPGYWGWNSGRYLFNTGYWGTTVGYYGGIDYGFGYGGLGYEGGYWRGGQLFYNRAVNNFGGVHVTNVFERNVTNVTVNRYAFNGPGGVDRRPTGAELAAAREQHVPPTTMQVQHVQAAQQNRALLASVNHGRPAITATPRPAQFNGAANRAAPGGVPLRGAQPGTEHPGVGHPGVGQPAARPYAPGPHPVTATHGSEATQRQAPVTRTPGVAAPHPVTREQSGLREGGTPTHTMRSAPERTAEPRAVQERTAEPRAVPQRTAEPRAVPQRTAEPRAMPERTAEPRPMPQRQMAAPHAAPPQAPHQQAAPHPGPAPKDEKPHG